MEEEKAAAYYDELSRKGSGAARFKQGLGFSSAASNDAVPSSASSFLSTFVKASSPSTSLTLDNQPQLHSIQTKLNSKSAQLSNHNQIQNQLNSIRNKLNSKSSLIRNHNRSSRSRSRSRSRERVGSRNIKRRSRSRSRGREGRRNSKRGSRSRSRSGDKYSRRNARRRRRSGGGDSDLRRSRSRERDSRRRSRSGSREKYSRRSGSRERDLGRRSRSGSREKYSRRRGSRERESRRRSRSGSGDRNLRRSRSRERESRRRSRSRERSSRRRSRSDEGRGRGLRKGNEASPRRGRRGEKSVKSGRNGGVDYGKLIEGYDKMAPAERVKAKMKLQLTETAEKDPTRGTGSGWERFDFDKDAVLDDEEIEATEDDSSLVKHLGQSFRFSAVEARKEDQIKAAHDEAMFGAPSLQLTSDVDEDKEDSPKCTNETATDTSLISNQVISMQQVSWRDRVKKM